MTPEEAETLCEALADLASKGPSKDPHAIVEAKGILRKITQASSTNYIRERADEVDRALSLWFDADERHHAVLKSRSRDIHALIDRLHSALREASRFSAR
jgi:hypothetical protein